MTYAHAHAHAHTSTHTITSSTLKEITNTCTHNLRMKLLEDTNTHVRQHIGRHATRKVEKSKHKSKENEEKTHFSYTKSMKNEKRCSDCCSCYLCCCSKIILLLGFSRFSISRRAWVHVQPAPKHTAWTVAQLPTTIELMKPRRPSLRSFFSTASPFSSPNHETAWRRSPTKTSRPCRTR